ncbi:DUF5693 family protein [Alkaliphilus hydrothermalis]|uniref:Uncharacterized protein n=1 Tax=Alkaliphilus hydrothermalis TaxID=1482730 RepID=A0ABS2NMS5_9FIRM|nr:DUF5693 family protein [Alkaliphilus hydrothermalis]MBM7614258.1 hypothetical protein [Alkaliphilus hydrothermalis]
MKNNKIILGVLLISLLVTSFNFIGRFTVESGNKRIDMVLDYYEFKELADQSEESLTWWFQQLKSMGVKNVALREETLEDLIVDGKPLEIEMAANILSDVNNRDGYPTQLLEYLQSNPEDHDFDAVVMTDSQELYQFISEKLQDRYESEKFTLVEDEGIYSIILKGTKEEALYQYERGIDIKGRAFLLQQELVSTKLIKLGLGLDPEKVKIIQDSGLEVMARPYQYDGWESEKLFSATFDEYKELNVAPSVLIFDGESVFGFPDYMHITKNYMKEKGSKVGLIEKSVQGQYIKQEGIDPLIKQLDYNAVGVFSMPEFIQMKFAHLYYTGAEEIENTLYRAVTERNIRVIYFRPFKIDKLTYVTDVEEYEKMFDRFEARIARHGMELGESSRMDPKRVSPIHQIMMGLGIVAAGILLLNTFVKLKEKYNILLLVFGGGFVVALIYGIPSLAGNMLAIGAAIVFASLSMVYFTASCSKYLHGDNNNQNFIIQLGRGIKDLLITSLISFVGALYVSSILSDIEYFIAMHLYRGVKIAQLVPMAVFLLAYLSYFGYKRKKGSRKVGIQISDIQKLLMEDIKVLYVLLGGIALVVGYVYIARTGHATDLQASNIEILVRNKLAELLLARPRTKEFLIAFPLLLMGFYAAQRRYKCLIFATGIVAVLGQTSIINTFSHFRTPVYLSIARTIYSLGLGIVLGIFYIVALEIGVKLLNSLRKHLNI